MRAGSGSARFASMSESKAMILGCAGTVLTATEAAFFASEKPWGFILFGRNVGTADALRRLVADLRAAVGRPDAPVFIDQEGGRVQRIRPPLAPAYPAAAMLGALHAADPGKGLRATRTMSRLIAFDLARYGIDADCMPVLDVPVAGANDVIGDRAYAREPAAVAALGRAAAEGLLAGGVLPVMKHVPGHGRALADSHKALPVVDAPIAELRARDFVPFRALADLPMAMTAHVVFTAIDPGRPATVSPVVVADIIRGEIGFDGLLMSDDLSMKALSGDFSEKAGAVLAAGCDVVLHCNGLMAEMEAVAAAVPPLRGRAAERAARALARTSAADGLPEAAMREEFAGLVPAMA